MTNLPTITVAFPTNVVGPDVQIHEAFLDASTLQPVYTYDIANGKSGATFTATALALKILAGKSYIFVFYLETGTAATPSPAPSGSGTATPSPAPSSTATSTAGIDNVTLPSTITSAAIGQASVTDPAFFSGLSGTHTFGRGGLASFNGGTPALVTDCKIVLGASSATISGGGATVTAPYISTNPNVQTALISVSANNEQLTFFDISGSCINLFFSGGRVVAASGLKTGVALSCSIPFASNITTDRSLDTLTLSAGTISTLTTRAGAANPYNGTNIVTADLGGAAGTVNFGRGTLTSGGVTTFVTDCALTVSGSTFTLSGGTFNQSASLTGASIDKILILAVQCSPTQFNFQPENGKILMQVNNFGFIAKTTGTAPDGSALACPA